MRLNSAGPNWPVVLFLAFLAYAIVVSALTDAPAPTHIPQQYDTPTPLTNPGPSPYHKLQHTIDANVEG